jgi:hypothetical protein
MSVQKKSSVCRRDTQAQIGGVSIEVPHDVLVLSLVGANSVFDGDDFKSDPHWVHNKNRHPRKAMRKINGTLVWTRKCERDYIRVLEEKLYSLSEKTNATTSKISDVMAKIEEAGGSAHAMSRDGRTVLFEASPDGYIKDFVSKPQEFVNLSLGQEMYLLTKRQQELNRRVWKFKAFFNFHVAQELMSERNSTIRSSHVVLKINGRTYIAHRQAHEWDLVSFECIEL